MSAPPKRLRRDRRTDILAATCEVVVRDGIDGLRSASVARAARTSEGLVHYHYPTLDDLVLAAYLWDQQRIWDPFDDLDPTADPLGTLDLLLAGQFAPPEAEVRAGFVLWQEYARRAVFDERIREVVVRRIERWVQVLATLIAAGAQRGEFADAGRAEEMAPGLASRVFGASVLHLIGLIPVEQAAADLEAQLAHAAAVPPGRAIAEIAVAPAPSPPAPDDAPTAILDATLALIARGGIRSVHFTDVGEEAGCSAALPRYHFGTMRDLLMAAFARFTEQRLDRVRAAAAAVDDPRTRVEFAIAALAALDVESQHGELAIWHEYLRLAFVHDAFGSAVRAAAQAEIDVVAALVADAQPEADAAAARGLVELVNGVGIGSLVGVLDAPASRRILGGAVGDALDAAPV